MKKFFQSHRASLSRTRGDSGASNESSQFSPLCEACLNVGIPLPESNEVIRTTYWTVDRIQDPVGLKKTIHFRQGSVRFASSRSREAHYKSACRGCLLCQLLFFAHEELGGNFEFNLDNAKWHIEKGFLETRPYYDVVNATFALSTHGGEVVTTPIPTDGSLMWDLVYEGYTDSDDPAAKYISNGGIDPYLGSKRSFERAKIWLTDCLENRGEHVKCPKYTTPNLPSRVIDVSHKDSKLLTLLETQGRKGGYAALSYVWGGPQEQSTTISNSKARMKGFQVSSMPQTLQDAVITTRQMGLKYLWVDSICILQDDFEQKPIEMGKMAQIYKNASVTIIASSSTSCREGFLEDRCSKHKKLIGDSNGHVRPHSREKYLPDGTLDMTPPVWITERYERTKVNKPDFREISGRPDIYDATLLKLPYRGPDGSLGTLHLHQHDNSSIRSDQPIHKRCWAIQERYLSPRVLSYCTDRLIFRCHNTCVENGTRNELRNNRPEVLDMAFFATDTKPTNLVKYSSNLIKGWRGIVFAFSETDLTVSSDALPAISGLAEEYARLSGDEYCAGIWKSTLPGALMWQSLIDGHFLRRVKPWRAPSWSFVSMEGTMTSNLNAATTSELLNHISKKNLGLDLEVMDCQVRLKNSEAPFGEITEGILTLSGKLMQGVAAHSSITGSLRLSIDVRHQHRADGGYQRDQAVGEVIPDVKDEAVQGFWFMKVAHEDRNRVVGLALTTVDESWFEGDDAAADFKRICGEQPTFRRIGIFRMDYNQVDCFNLEKSRTIRII